ncbi:MAG: hypothetical protein M1820_007514 [Bogoriella megaspora]|nr:MAG: hypothetical protein M1820_007514 [Bogoriella megaspora]
MESAWGIRDSPNNGSTNPRQASSSASSVVVQPVERIAVELPNTEDDDDYVSFADEEKRVRKILKEVRGRGQKVVYKVRFGDNHTEEISFDNLLELEDGPSALENFTNNAENSDSVNSSDSDRSAMVETRVRRKQTSRKPNYVDTAQIEISSEDELSGDPTALRGRPRGSGTRISLKPGGRNRSIRSRVKQVSSDEGSVAAEESEESEDSEEFDGAPRQRRSKRQAGISSQRQGRITSYQRLGYKGNVVEEFEDESSEDDGFILQSDVLPSRKRKRGVAQRVRRGRPRISRGGIEFEQVSHAPSRRSGRSTRHQENMQEANVNDIYRSDSDRPAPKAVGAREKFMILPRDDEFRLRHCQQCESCGNGQVVGQLIFCQGCTLAYHKGCLGPRNGREHLVTKIGEDDFILQCRRCVGFPKKKEPTAPDQGKCQVCREVGQSCVPFRERKTMLQEQKLREENDGIDPVSTVDPDLVNNVDSVQFRCLSCWRAWHFHHLPSLTDNGFMDLDTDQDGLAEQRFREYCRDWTCKECRDMPAKVAGLIAWKPVEEEDYTVEFQADMVEEDDKAYLIKWENMSYFRASWMPGAWVWGVTSGSMRKAFAKREAGQNPIIKTEDAIPEEYFRVDIVLSVKYTSIVDIRTEEVDKARIKEVDKALVKYKGLGYEDAVWEKPPAPDEQDRWDDWVTAYNDWVMGRYVHLPKSLALKMRLEKVRAMDFGKKLEKKKQPEYVKGGELMQYQIDGLNWLYYRWFSTENAILADEMGLGKTIQIIGMIATLVHDHNCFPFLVVVPNSTCPNWRREIKHWAPSLRVVTYFGIQASRNLAYQHELFPEGSKDLRCHVVVTSYETAADPSCQKLFRRVPWQGLVVDEGQRIKNDKTILYSTLSALKIPFRILVTGTPLQNNARELFNLLQFLDDSFDAAVLEAEYAELTAQNVPKLHDMIRPFFLRRTKAQVLTFLPPMAQIIVPVSMSVVQKKLYMSILAKNPDLLKSIFTADSVKKSERGSLNNILIQLRKCLCHPFVYSQEIEERSTNPAVSHRNLVEASSKLQLLEILLPKLRERGHRVLIFSQFLNMLDLIEDFLDGLELQYHRLDGTVSSLQKQKRIDEFNAPDSPFFAFLLSTRAGGVGINLATADTVIILDPDFNPHQDIQALSRAHRIGQKKKVLCYQLMTRASAEEKIVQIGRKKMALDHVLIEKMDAEDTNELDMESILRHGASELFNENSEQDIKYDSASVDKLLDRSQVENTQAGNDNSAESQFSYARVWANADADLDDSLHGTDTEDAPDPTVWDRILKERERAAAVENAAKEAAFGRGRRARANVDYNAEEQKQNEAIGISEDSPLKPVKANKRRKDRESESDTDFQAEDSDEESEPEPEETVDASELSKSNGSKTRDKEPKEFLKVKSFKNKSLKVKIFKVKSLKYDAQRRYGKSHGKSQTSDRALQFRPALSEDHGRDSKVSKISSQFRRARVPVIPVSYNEPSVPTPAYDPSSYSNPSNPFIRYPSNTAFPHPVTSPNAFHWPPEAPAMGTPLANIHTNTNNPPVPYPPCPACDLPHPTGSCPLKIAGVELCGLCGLAHFGSSRTCPHINSETQVREMLAALKSSSESKELVSEARRYLSGVKGTLVQKKKAAKERREYEKGRGGELDRESGIQGFGYLAGFGKN